MAANELSYSVTIYRTNLSSPPAGLAECLRAIQQTPGVRLSEIQVPAVVGEFAGPAIQVLLSDPVQSALTLAELGGLLTLLLRAARSHNKKVAVSKSVALPIAVERIANLLEVPELPENQVVIWGPMEVDGLEGLPEACRENWDGATLPAATFVAVVVRRPNNRAKTFWHLISADGRVCAAWETQTILDRLPDFLRPR